MILISGRTSRRIKKNKKPNATEVQANMFLEIFGMCQNLNVLPRNGGLLDQDGFYVYLMKHAIMAQAERAELDNHAAAQKK